MEKKEFTGQTFEFVAMPTFTAGGMGTMFMFKNADGNYVYGDVSDCNFWMKEFNDEFQNMEHLCKGLEYVDAMSDSSYKRRIIGVLNDMKGHTGGLDLSRRIAFFCELGCWEDEKVRRKNLYDKEFYTYAKRCLNAYNLFI